MRKLYIVIGCDTDPDRVGFIDNVPADTLVWTGMTKGIPRLKSATEKLIDHNGKPPVFTWLLRVDEQVRRVHGQYGWVLREYPALLRDLEESGDELGWHPHFWRFDDAAGKWYQEIADIPWQIQMLEGAHADYHSVLPGRAKSVRMGWDYHNDQTLAALDRLGVLVDFSAIPGLRTLRERNRPHPENLFDWSTTPRMSYRPSRADYRRPARPGEEALQLLEAPNFVSTSPIWSMISGLQFARKMGDPGHLWRSIARPTYWINLTGRPSLFAPLLSTLRQRLRSAPDRDEVFITYFHPDELLDNRSSLYSLEAANSNIRALLDLCAAERAAPVYLRASMLPEFLTPAQVPG